MTVKRKILIGLPLLLVLLLVGAYVFLDHLAKRAIEIGGEQAMGVPTSLEGIALKPIRGEGSLEGLQVSHPSGFETPFFMRLSKADAALDMGSIFTDTVVMKSIELDGLTAHLEKSKEGANYEVILANSMVVFVALIPFFAMKELGRVVGREKIGRLFFRQRRPA